jgi:hypothetical protein
MKKYVALAIVVVGTANLFACWHLDTANTICWVQGADLGSGVYCAPDDHRITADYTVYKYLAASEPTGWAARKGAQCMGTGSYLDCNGGPHTVIKNGTTYWAPDTESDPCNDHGS